MAPIRLWRYHPALPVGQYAPFPLGTGVVPPSSSMHPDSGADTARTFTLSDFDFELPPQLIAQHPAPERTASRLLDGRAATPVDRIFKDLPGLLRKGDLLVFNDTKVVNARLWGEKPTGGKAELLIERVLGGEEVAAHVRVSKKPPVGTTLKLVCAAGQEDGFSATLLGRWPDADGPLFRFRLFNNAGDNPYTLMERHGQIPLPPYIERPQGGATNPNEAAEDLQRYQTVFAKNPGAVAAPTAALHFDDGLFAQLDAMGVERAFVTLHVGAGTFQPVKTESLAEHRMHSEWFDVPQATQDAIAACRARGGAWWRWAPPACARWRAGPSSARPAATPASSSPPVLPSGWWMCSSPTSTCPSPRS